MIRLAILSPVPAVRAGLRALIDENGDPTSENIRVIYETGIPDDLPRYYSDLDILLIAWEDLPDSTLSEIIVDTGGQLPILLISDSTDDAHNLLKSGPHTWGILPLEATADELAAAVYALQQGLIVGTRAAIGSLYSGRRQTLGQDLDEMVEDLTERELQVLQLLGRGLANKQIAVNLGISEHTVKFHVSSIYTKLGVNSRTEAVRAGVLRGLVVL